MIGLFLGGNPDRADRLWPPAAWAELSRKLTAAQNANLLAIVPPRGSVSGRGAPEPGIYQAVSHLLGEPMPVFSDPDLRKVAAFLSLLTLFISSDGGLLHVAVAARVPTLGLFFGTDSRRWLPSVEWTASLGADQPSSNFSPDDVFQKAQEILFNKTLIASHVEKF